MSDASSGARDGVTAALQTHRPEDVGDGMLVGWALVAEYMDSDGVRCLTKICGPVEEGIATWTAAGMFRWAERREWEAMTDANDDGGS